MAIKLEPENLVHCFYLSELKKNFLNTELKNKTEKILSNKKSHKMNFVLIPLYEISKKCRHPKYKLNISQLLIKLGSI